MRGSYFGLENSVQSFPFTHPLRSCVPPLPSASSSSLQLNRAIENLTKENSIRECKIIRRKQEARGARGLLDDNGERDTERQGVLSSR